jgi:serine/threonine-protein kinase
MFFRFGTLSLSLGLLFIFLLSCGRAPSSLLRQGQLPLFDFPLYVSEGVPGNIWRYERNASRTLLINGLNDPRGIASDKWGNLFVAERGAGRVLKINLTSGVSTVIATSLQQPTIVAVDSFGEAYVTQDTPQNIIRVSDQAVITTYSGRPSGIFFGVNDLLVASVFDTNTVFWGRSNSSPSATVSQPVNVAMDSLGRVYIAEGLAANAHVYRFNQTSPTGMTSVADSLNGPQGIAVDPAQNIFVVEQGAGRIVLVTYDGNLFQWTGSLIDPQYLAFTQY